jgi:hypothetical protein
MEFHGGILMRGPRRWFPSTDLVVLSSHPPTQLSRFSDLKMTPGMPTQSADRGAIMKNEVLKRAKTLFAPVALAIAMAAFSPTASLAAEHYGGHSFGGGHGGGFSGGIPLAAEARMRGAVTMVGAATAGPSMAAEGIMADAVTTARVTLAAALV